MTDKNNNNPIRSKLTLKLSSSVINNSTITPNNSNDKKSSNSVQVTIKGRKTSQKDSANLMSKDLNRNELEARMKAISKDSSKFSGSDIKTHEILSKINKENRQNEVQAQEKLDDSNEEVVVIEKVEEIETAIVEEKKVNSSMNVSDAKLDGFDVRNKIKLSLQIANKQKEDREKLLEDKRKKEQVEKERIENEKKKFKKPVYQNQTPQQKTFQDEEARKKPNVKDVNKDQKFNSRKLTYIISSEDSDDDSSFSRRKKHKHHVKEESKEYKKINREVNLPELITVSDLAERMSEKAGDVVKKLFTMGMVVTSNQAIDAETAEIIVNEFGHTSKRVSHSDVENVLDNIEGEDFELLPRAPIVTIMGHVDHGKTSLLDALRQTDVASGEHGGITQHIGASRIQTKSHKFITFLDTPGHEAFTEMRSRGANVTDIVVLVVAADDGVKEQTIEAINHAKAANVPIIVAVNKIDKPGANPQVVKNELLSHQLISEDLGGDVMFISVSAKAKTNLDKLEEAILLQAEFLELKAPYQGKSSGVVIESRVDPARGVVATMLVQKGTLDVGDLVVVGTSYGKVRKMNDDNGKHLKTATPSVPVEILGLDSAPNAGDTFVEVSEERQAREIIAYRLRKEKEVKALRNSAKSISDIFKESGKGKLKYLNIIIKGDVHGSVEAIAGTISKLSTDEVAIKIIHSATGGISESDVSLAAASGAIIIGFNVRANPSAKELADLKGTDLRYYSIIYNLVDDLKLLLSGLLAPLKSEEYLGKAEVRQIFKITNVGKIAGCFVTGGVIKRNGKARLVRDSIVIHDGILKTLKRFKEDAKEVKNGFECGIAFENFEDIKEKDTIECYEVVEQKRSI